MTFNPIPAAEFLSGEMPPIVWVWDKLIPEGALFTIAGFMKTGKSTFIYPLAVSVAQGRPFLGFRTKQGGVLLLAVEEQNRDVRIRFERFGMKPDDPIFIHCGSLSCNSLTLDQIRNFILENNIVLLLIDTLSLFWNVRDENANAEVTRMIKPLLDIAHSIGCSIGLVHHTSKQGGSDGRGIRGASALFGIVDQALLLEPRQGGNKNQRVLRALGRYSESPSELIIELREDGYVCLGSGACWEQEQTSRVLSALSNGPQTVEGVSEITGLSDKQCRTRLDSLLSQGQIARNGEGKKGKPFVYSSM